MLGRSSSLTSVVPFFRATSCFGSTLLLVRQSLSRPKGSPNFVCWSVCLGSLESFFVCRRGLGFGSGVDVGSIVEVGLRLAMGVEYGLKCLLLEERAAKSLESCEERGEGFEGETSPSLRLISLSPLGEVFP